MTKITPNLKIVFTYFGNGIALGGYGKKQDIEMFLDGIYNHGGHDDDIVYLSETFGYILTTKEQLIHGLVNMQMVGPIQENMFKPRGQERALILKEAREQAERNAKRFVEELTLENFLTSDTSVVEEYAIPFKK